MKRICITFAAAALSLTQLAGAAGTSIAVEGLAPTRDESFVLKRAVVRYGDLNIAEAQGAATLRTRIENAAVAVCKNGNVPSSNKIAVLVEKCRVDAVNNALAKAGLPKQAMN